MKKAAKVASGGRASGSNKDMNDKIIKAVKVGRQGRVEDELRAGKNQMLLA